MSVSVRPRFSLGIVLATPGAIASLEASHVLPGELLERHQGGDWGELCLEDRQANEEAVELGFRIVSSYPIGKGVKVWIITEGDRSATTLLLPSEY